MKDEYIQRVLKNHKYWLEMDCNGRSEMRMRLNAVNFQAVDFSYADLREAIILRSYLDRSILFRANMYQADLRETNFSDADMRDVNLRRANLIKANLRGANLYGADLRDADLRKADLRDAIVERALFYGADLDGAKIDDKIIALTNCCPQEGSFIGFKKCGDKIVKLRIPADAKRSNATTNKCRCDKAKVLGIYNFDHQLLDIKKVCSDFDRSFIYEVGKIAKVDNFVENRWNECAPGIHFFLTFEMAVMYSL